MCHSHSYFSFIIHHNHNIVNTDNDDDIPVPEITQLDYVNLTTHSDTFGKLFDVDNSL